MVKKEFLLDTNIISEPIKINPNQKVLEKIKHYQEHLYSAAIVLHEILCGMLKMPDSKRKTFIGKYIHDVVEPNIKFLPYDHHAAIWHARERSRLAQVGIIIPSFADGQIAAIAQVNNLILVSRNIKDFQHIKGLHCENWFED